MMTSRVFEEAVACHRAGRAAQAATLYHKVLGWDPGHRGALMNLSALLTGQNQLDEAEQLSRRMIELEPQNPIPHNQLGVITSMRGEFRAAAEAFREALKNDPNLSDGWNNLAFCLRSLDDPVGCEDASRRALALRPAFPEALNNLGAALQAMERFEQAADCFRKAIALRPHFPQAHMRLGAVLLELGDKNTALAEAQAAVAQQPDNAEALAFLGSRLIAMYRLTEAETNLRRAIDVCPGYASAYGGLATTLQKQGRTEEAIVAYRKSLELDPDNPRLHDDLLLIMHAVDSVAPDDLFQDHLEWARHHTQHLVRFEQYDNDPNPDRQLRVGWVSADFRSHSVAFFLQPIVENFDRRKFQFYAYSSTTCPDALTDRIRTLVDVWHDIGKDSPETVAQLVRRDGIDILIDLGGHTGDSRLLVFAQKPAPIQVAYLGYPDTTGLKTIDYRITDAVADPVGLADRLSAEKLVRLPTAAWCYAPESDVPPVKVGPTIPLAFASFSTMHKITERWLAVWCRILQAVPDSRLVIKNGAMADPGVSRRIQELARNHGVSPDRIDLRQPTPKHHQHLASYNEIDIALDTFPYNGTTTTCDALWMGVPVVTMTCQSHASRVGASLLTAVGLKDLIAGDPQSYLDIAVDLAANERRRTDLRRSLRDRMRQTTLIDAPRFMTGFEQALREMWVRWCTK